MTAVPALIHLTESPRGDARYFALLSLRAIRPPQETFLPVLLRTVHDPSHGVERISAITLVQLYPQEAEKAGVSSEFPYLKSDLTNVMKGEP
jgi:hypothetical protein